MDSTQKLMDMIVQEYSWQQAIYKIISWENLDPWNLDLAVLADSFIGYMSKLEHMDFKIPAKYIAISAVLLRMKSDQVKILSEDEIFSVDGLVDADVADYPEEGSQPGSEQVALDPGLLGMPMKRRPVRKIVVTELVAALKKALGTQYRRKTTVKARSDRIKFEYTENINLRINNLYSKINNIVGKMKDKEVTFSSVVEKWDRSSIVGSFVPLVHLDNNQNVSCRQEKLFDEIFIRKGKPLAQTAPAEIAA